MAVKEQRNNRHETCKTKNKMAAIDPTILISIVNGLDNSNTRLSD